MKKEWTIREKDDIFNKGDLVLVKQYSCYDLANPFGYKNDNFGNITPSIEIIEELLKKETVCLGIITEKEIISWEPEAEMWMMATMDKPYRLVQFRVYCSNARDGVKSRLIESTAMKMVSRGEISRGIEESLNNLANNKQK
jgi:hypothetical protein